MKSLLPPVVLTLALLFAAAPCQLFAQASPVASSTSSSAAPVANAPSEIELSISSTQAWTDTGLDLHPGDVLEIMSSPPDSTSAPGPGSELNSAASSCRSTATADSSVNLQLPSAPLGALVGKLHRQGAEPFLVDDRKQIKIEEQGHLFLAVNVGEPATCQQTVATKVKLTSAAVGQTTAPPKDIKSKLAAAAQTWIAGQFGTPNAPAESSTEPGPSAAATGSAANARASVPNVSRPLNVSTAPLDPKLRDAIDHLPRRVNDQLKNLGDMVNFVIVGSQQDVQDALEAAHWFEADSSNAGAVTKAILMTYENKDYVQMPMSQLYLFGRVQDFGYEQAEPYSVVASRHHFRLWKAPFQIDGQQVWVGAGTHDVGFEKDQRNGQVTHKIDPAVDKERDHIATTLGKTGLVKKLSYYLPPDPVQQAKNATGGSYHSDGRILLMWIEGNAASRTITAGPQ
jgi:hypothetical protein